MPKCSCHRIAPRCAYCKKVSRDNNKKNYSTEARRERARKERAEGVRYYRGNYKDEKDIRQAEMILSRKPPSSAITWLDIYAGRSNS